MKHNLIIRILALVFFTGVLISETYAQGPGKIVGKITDKKTGETLIGVSVKISEANKGTTTDVEGRYALNGLIAGTFTVEFSYIGYPTKKISDIVVSAGKVTNLDVVMEESGQELKAVVITATAKTESVGGLYVQQKNAVSMSSGISADVIKRSPDRNTGEVMKRISGASVQDNKFIVVRGLSDRYNSAMINNSPMPSSEPDRKTFSFDIIPSNLIDNVIISKTATPDMPGEFAGGVTQIKTKDFPELKNLQINYGVSYNSISTFKEFYGNSRPILDFTGFGASSRALPVSFPSRTRFVNSPLDQQISLAKKFDNSWGAQRQGRALPAQNLQITYGNSYYLKNDSKFGVIASATYRNSAGISEQQRNDYNLLNDAPLDPLFKYNDMYYNFNTSLGLLGNLSYTKGNSKFSLKNVFNKTFEDNYLNRFGFDDDDNAERFSQQEVVDKSLFNSVIEGDHLLSQSSQSKINWNISFSRITNDQPDLRRLAYRKNTDQLNDPSVPFTAAINPTASQSDAGRFFSELDENVYGASFNYTLPFTWLNDKQIVKVGLLKQYKQRDVSARVLGYVNRTSNASTPEEASQMSEALLKLPIDQIFAPENIAADKFMLEDITNTNNTYDASGDLNAGYLMLTNTLFKKLKATWGLRVENYIENLNTIENSTPTVINNNYVDILPSVNLTYALSAKSNIRAAFSSTVARAQFRELAPFTFYNASNQLVERGNEDLKRTQIQNFDLRYEIYPSSGQLFSVSTFYKNMTNAIEKTIGESESAASKVATFLNAPEADVYGLEVEMRQSLGFISPSSSLMKSLIVSANAAVIKSEVDFGASAVKQNQARRRPLQGQSPYLINAGLQYNAAKTGWQANVLYNRIGKRISFVGMGNYNSGEYFATYPDIYEASRDVLDFQVSKQIIKSKGEIKLSVSNLLNSNGKFYQNTSGNTSYDASVDNLNQFIRYGTTMSLSFGYSF